MTKRLTFILVACAWAATVLATHRPAGAQPQTAGSSAAPASASEPDERYQVLVDQNIFMRQRGRRTSSPATTSPTSRPAARTPEQSLVLTGVVFEDGEFRAYFEDLGKSSVVRVSNGDAIARGTVAAIMIDAVAYESDDGVRWIEFGQDLTGGSMPIAERGTTGTTEPNGSDQASADAGGGDDASLSVEERMRRRSAQQRGTSATGRQAGESGADD